MRVNPPLNILYVDDEISLLEITKEFLEKTGDILVETCSKSDIALKLIQNEKYDVIVADYQMPQLNGIDLLQTIRDKGDDTPFVIFTGKGEEDVAINALNKGADFYLRKSGYPQLQFQQLQDIIYVLSANRKSELTLKRNEERYRALISSSHTGAWEYDSKTDELWCSPEYFTMLDRDISEFQSDRSGLERWVNLMHPEDRTEAQKRFQKYLRSGSSAIYESTFRMQKKDGEYIWIWSRGRTLKDDNGNFTNITAGTHIDIDNIKKMESALRNSENRFRYLADNGKTLIWTAGTDALCDYFNKPWLDYTGRSMEQELGNGWSEGVHPDDFDRCVNIYREAFGKREFFTMPYRLRHNDGTYRWIQDDGTPRYNDRGQFEGYIGHCFDIHEMRELQESLRVSNQKLNLLSSITRHDILNQLMTLRGFLDLLKDENNDDERIRYCEIMENAAAKIQTQIEFTRQYQDVGVKSPEWHDLTKLVPVVNSERIPFTAKVNGLQIYADSLFEKVFRNLIDNTVRHAEGATKATLSYAIQSDNSLVLTYMDDGHGIAQDEKEKIFLRGFGKNTGLGLFLIKEILAITGISIKETGVFGEGARFEMHIMPDKYHFI